LTDNAGHAGQDTYTIGIDFGTLSGRAVLVRTSDGEEVASAEHEYASGVVDESLNGTALPPDWALQDPADWIEVVRNTVPAVLRESGIDPASVLGIGTDTTACTVLPCKQDGTPLCQLDEFRDRPHAWPKLWRHHAAQPQADRINALAAERGEAWLARYGGRLSSEWELAKGLQLLEEDPEVYEATDLWVEFADWIIWRLCGSYARNRCTAGYKGAYQDGSYPSRDFFAALDERFADFAETKLVSDLAELGTAAGRLTAEAAEWTGLPEGIAVAVGNVDAHVTVPAAQAIEPGTMVAVMGTSTCHVMNSNALGEVPGMCGVVDGGITPGTYGYEAGQSGVGDIFAWWARVGFPPSRAEQAADGENAHDVLTRLAREQRPGAHGLVALDWMSGNRSILVDHELSGVIVGLTLDTKPEDVYRALIEATAFGTRRIIEAFDEAGVPVRRFVAAGGLIKSSFVMQLYADIIGMPISVIGSDQGPALGSAIHAAVAAGVHPDITAAAKAMGKVRPDVYQPNEKHRAVYDELYTRYVTLHDWFGRSNDELHELRRIRNRVRSQP
jgi:L-ribulokinase